MPDRPDLNSHPGRSPFLRSPLPGVNASSDDLRQFYLGGQVPQTRLIPPAQGLGAATSSGGGSTTTIISNENLVTTPIDFTGQITYASLVTTSLTPTGKIQAAINATLPGGIVVADFTGTVTLGSSLTINKKLNLVFRNAIFQHSTTAVILQPGSDGSIIESDGGAILQNLATSGDQYCVGNTGWTLGTQYPLASDTPEDSSTVVLGTGAGANLAAGDFVLLGDNDNILWRRLQLNRVLSVSGDTVTMLDPATTFFTTANTAYLQKVSGFLSDITIRNLRMNGSGSTSTGGVYGVALQYLLRPDIHDLLIENFHTGVGGGFSITGAWEGHIEGIQVKNSGTTSTDAWAIWASAHTKVSKVSVAEPSVQTDGIGVRVSHYCQLSQMTSDMNNVGARAFKTFGANYNTFSQIEASRASNSFNGVNITASSNHNRFVQCAAYNNSGDGWVTFGEAPGNKYNVLIDCKAIGNTVSALSNPATDNNMVVIGGEFEGGTANTNGAIGTSGNGFTMHGAIVRQAPGTLTTGGLGFGTISNVSIVGCNFIGFPTTTVADIAGGPVSNSYIAGNFTPGGIAVAALPESGNHIVDNIGTSFHQPPPMLGYGVGPTSDEESAIYTQGSATVSALIIAPSPPTNTSSNLAFTRLVTLGASGLVLQAWKSVSAGSPVAANVALGSGATTGQLIIDTGGNITATSLAGVGTRVVQANATGTLSSTTVALPANTTATTHQFLIAYDSSTGTFSKAQPAAGDLSDGTTGSGTVVLNTSPALAGVPTVSSSPTVNGVINQNFTITDTRTAAAGVGGGIGFLGAYTGTTTTTAAGISASKTNGSAGDFGFDLVFAARQNGGGLNEILRLNSDKTATFQSSVTATIFNGTTGFRVNGAAAAGNVLRGNGTNFVSATLAAADLSDGVTGSGAGAKVMLNSGPTIGSGDLVISSGTVNVANPYKVGGTAGISSKTFTYKDGAGANQTITITGGLVTAVTGA